MKIQTEDGFLTKCQSLKHEGRFITCSCYRFGWFCFPCRAHSILSVTRKQRTSGGLCSQLWVIRFCLSTTNRQTQRPEVLPATSQKRRLCHGVRGVGFTAGPCCPVSLCSHIKGTHTQTHTHCDSRSVPLINTDCGSAPAAVVQLDQTDL